MFAVTDGEESWIVMLSAPSATASVSVATLTVFVVSPGAKLTLPDADVKYVPEVAVPADVASCA